MTNAVRASEHLKIVETPVVLMQLMFDRAAIVIHVWDGCREMPVLRQADPSDENGRGLSIVDALSAAWGAYPKANGKVVWARVGATADP